jgi:23S rRNA (uracil1939-C5)-methyltransferase
MKKKKYPLYEQVLIEDFAAEGKCLARVNDKVVFVEGPVAPGDLVDVRIHRQKKQFEEGTALHIQPLSSLRQAPTCSHFGTCGGCKWQHISYENQLVFKQKQVQDALERIAKVALPEIQPIVGSANTFFYRNKLEFTFASHRWLTQEEIESEEVLDKNALGFHIPKRYDKILELNQCYLQPEPSNSIRQALRELARRRHFPFYSHVNQEGFLRNLIIRNTTTGGLMVIVSFGQNLPEEIAEIMAFLRDTFPQITSLQYVINPKGNDTIFDLEVVCFHGLPYIEEKMEALTFRIGPKSFYQTNGLQAYELYKITRNFAQLTGQEIVYDLYTGTGTIAQFVAHQARRVIGLEYIEMAVEDAKVNAQINGLENTAFFAGDMKKLLTADFLAQHGRPDVVITDPPRAGMDEEVVRVLIEAAPQRIIYVSCNPATQARDLAWLDEHYEVRAVQPVDMFPQTHHVENVVWLEKRS